MAQVLAKGGKGTPNVDLTPMVDLGFLLITFFMFTTTMSSSKAMEIQMPFIQEEKIEAPSVVKESTAMTILLGKQHEVYYYYGIGNEPNVEIKMEKTNFDASAGIRDAINWKKTEVQRLIAAGTLQPDDKMTVIIKATDQSTADDLVGILDEMSINTVPVYTFGDVSEKELESIGKSVF